MPPENMNLTLQSTENQQLVSGGLGKKKTPPKQVEYLSLLHSNVELISGYNILTAVN